MKKRGFTLIELLAVIVILAIIALIATPIVMNLIENSKKGAAARTAENIEKAAELYYYENRLDGLFPGITFTCNNENCSSNDKVLQINGKVPENGKVIINDDGTITLNSIVINGYVCYKNGESYACDRVKKADKKSNNGLLTLDQSKTTELSNYIIKGNTKTNDGFKNIADPQQIEKFVAGMQALGATNYGNLLNIITDENGRKVLKLCSYSGHGHDNYVELKKIFSGIFKENTQYTISFDFYREADSNELNLLIKYTDGNYISIEYPESVYKNEIYHFTYTTDINKTIQSIDLEFRSGITYIYLDTLQIEEGIVETKYVPYGYFDYHSVGNFITDKADKNYGKYEIPVKVTGKNLFNENHLLEKNSVAKVENGYSVAAYPTQYGKSSLLYKNIKSVLKEEISYTLSRKVSNYVEASSGAIFFRTPDSTLFLTNPYSGISSKNFTLDNSQINDFSSVWIFGLTANPTIFEYIQLEIGDNATEYEPYKEENYSIYLDEPLRCVDGVCDYIDFISGKLVRSVGVKSDGSLIELEDKISEDVDLPSIKINKNVSNIFIDTYVTPSEVTVEYYK